jgi:hypothetical protein
LGLTKLNPRSMPTENEHQKKLILELDATHVEFQVEREICLLLERIASVP